MTKTTSNGWPVDPPLTTVRGTQVAQGTGEVFAWLLDQLDDVEPLVTLHGYRSQAFNDTLPGSSKSSNHVSGTAIDRNGGEHPNEANGGAWSSGFTQAEVDQIRRILAAAHGLFRWGMDFNKGYRDPMHFEVAPGKTQTDVNRFAATIATAPPPEEEGRPMLVIVSATTSKGAIIYPSGRWAFVTSADDGFALAAAAGTKSTTVSDATFANMTPPTWRVGA